LRKAIEENGKPSLSNIDQNGAYHAGLKQLNRDHKKRIKIRQCKYLNNIIEQARQRIKRRMRPMMGFKKFHAAQWTLAGIEVRVMLKKGHLRAPGGGQKSPAEIFYTLAA